MNDLTLNDIVKPDDFFQEVKHIMQPKTFNWLLTNSKNNGLQESGAVIIRNHKRLIVRPKFTQWLLDNQNAA